MRILPLVLYGFRLWAAVCLALFVAFKLELDNPFWAGTSAAIVCQPALGASLRKGWFRLLGTIIGAAVAVGLTACFPQSRFGFLTALALWGGACAFMATILRNFAGYAAALSGYTAAIIAADELGAVGGLNGQAFDLAVTRASEICIGIICAGIVLALTDLGDARRRLADLLRRLAQETLRGTLASLQSGASGQDEARQRRRDLVRRVAETGTVIDQAIGESSDIRFNPRPLQAGVDGLWSAISAWRVIALHLERTPPDQAEAAGSRICSCVPGDLLQGWPRDPEQIRRQCLATARALVALDTASESDRLLADHMAEALLGISRCMTALGFLANPIGTDAGRRVARLRVPDLLPAWLNGLRAFLTIVATALIWIVTAWPSGSTAMLFAAIGVILFSPREYSAVPSTANFMVGTGLTAVLAAVIGFAVLPQVTTYFGFCLAIGVVLVPAAALSAQPWRGPMFIAAAANFIPLLGPSNPASYDIGSFYNEALAIMAGIAMAICALRLLPPLSPDVRVRRLLTLTLRDLRRLAGGTWHASIGMWESDLYGRLIALPEQSDQQQASRLVAALALGTEIIRVRRYAKLMDQGAELEIALKHVAAGEAGTALLELGRIDAFLAAAANTRDPAIMQRLRGSLSVIRETLAQHGSYFGASLAA